MGEIGIARREFLHEINWWEANAILRGYRKRDILKFQLLRLVAYHSFYSMRSNEDGTTPTEWLPLYFDEEDAMPTQEEIDDMKAEMAALGII